MTNTELLNEAIKKSGKSKVHLAKKMGISRFGFYKKINGESEFYASEIAVLESELMLSKSEREQIFFSR